MKKRILSLLLVLLMVVSLVPTAALAEDNIVAYKVTGGNIYFNKSTGEIIDCDAGVTEANIPSEIDGVKVTSIGYKAFEDCTGLTNVTIPVGVTGISNFAFSGCIGLKSLAIPDDVTSIGAGAFQDCTNLTSVRIPNRVTVIDEVTFHNCTSLKSITIPDSITSIGAFAFNNCSSLESVFIPKGIESIGVGAFRTCSSLERIDVAVGNEAYSSIAGVLFTKNQKTLVVYPCSKADKSYIIPESVTSVSSEAFAFCTKLEKVSITDAIEKIEYGTFRECSNLRSIVIPDSVCEIGNWAFAGCESLETVSIGKNVSEIGEMGFTASYVFGSCVRLISINVNDENSAFSSINGVLFNKEKTTIIMYPQGKTDESYRIPDSVTSIGCKAFFSCTNLSSITIPDSVTSIEDVAFSDCQSLTDVYYTGTEEQWNAISIEYEFNESLMNATIHYNYHEHVTELRNAVEPTCTEAGYTGDEVCSICGETIKEGEVIPATGHHFKGNTCPDCGETRSTADTVRAWFQESFNNMKNFFDKIFGRN